MRRNNSTAANHDVHYLQQLLVKNGSPVATDGFFDPKTEQAVIKFKKQNKIAVDGIVSPQNWNLLGAVMQADVKSHLTNPRRTGTHQLIF